MSTDGFSVASPIAADPGRGLRVFPVWIVLIALVGFHLNTPICLTIFGTSEGPGVSLEFFTSIPLVLFALGGWSLLFHREKARWCVLAYAGFVVWVLLAAMIVRPDSMRLLVAPVAQLAILCGTAYVFYHHWPSLRGWLPAIILSTVAVFLAWTAWMWLTGRVEVEYIGGTGVIVARHNVGNVLSTEITMFLGPQLCYLLYLLRARRANRPLLFALVPVNIVLVFLSGGRAGIAAVALVLCLYILSGSLARRLRLAVLFGIILVFAGGAVWPYVRSIQLKAQSILAYEEEQNVRLQLYPLLWELAREHPFFGIGHGTFIYENEIHETKHGHGVVPHHNILGRACENGMPAGLFYLAFVLLALRALRAKKPSGGAESALAADARLFVQACLWAFIFLQARGLFQDTWALKEIPFVVGAGLGLRAWIQSHETGTAHSAEEER